MLLQDQEQTFFQLTKALFQNLQKIASTFISSAQKEHCLKSLALFFADLIRKKTIAINGTTATSNKTKRIKIISPVPLIFIFINQDFTNLFIFLNPYLAANVFQISAFRFPVAKQSFRVQIARGRLRDLC